MTPWLSKIPSKRSARTLNNFGAERKPKGRQVSKCKLRPATPWPGGDYQPSKCTFNVNFCKECSLPQSDNLPDGIIDWNVRHWTQVLPYAVIDILSLRMRKINDKSPLVGLVGLWNHPKATCMSIRHQIRWEGAHYPSFRHFWCEILSDNFYVFWCWIQIPPGWFECWRGGVLTNSEAPSYAL